MIYWYSFYFTCARAIWDFADDEYYDEERNKRRSEWMCKSETERSISIVSSSCTDQNCQTLNFDWKRFLARDFYWKTRWPISLLYLKSNQTETWPIKPIYFFNRFWFYYLFLTWIQFRSMILNFDLTFFTRYILLLNLIFFCNFSP